MSFCILWSFPCRCLTICSCMPVSLILLHILCTDPMCHNYSYLWHSQSTSNYCSGPLFNRLLTLTFWQPPSNLPIGHPEALSQQQTQGTFNSWLVKQTLAVVILKNSGMPHLQQRWNSYRRTKSFQWEQKLFQKTRGKWRKLKLKASETVNPKFHSPRLKMQFYSK